MVRNSNRLFMSIAICCTAFMLQAAHAEQTMLQVTSPNHFVIQLPHVDRETLMDNVRTLRSQLIQRKQALAQIIADSTLDSGDAFIMAIMPGGLFYAGYKKATSTQARHELASISADIEEFSTDILAMQTGAAPVFVARLR